MKPRTTILPALSLLTILALSAVSTTRADGIDTHELTIDVYAVDMEQSTNNTAFDITERIYFNNSGSSPFTGTLYSWLSPMAQVSSAVCSSTSTMIVRVVDS